MTSEPRCGCARRRALVSASALALLGLYGGSLGPVQAAVPKESTTYCWKVPTSVYAAQDSLKSVAGVVSSTDAACPVQLVMKGTGEYKVSEHFAVNWTATLQQDSDGTLKDNALGVEQVSAAKDKATNRFYQILESRLYSCSTFDEIQCDPITGSSSSGFSLVDTTRNQVGNFTDGSAFFQATTSFATPATYWLLAHLELAGANPEQERFDYAVYVQVRVKPADQKPVATQASKAESQASVSDGGGLSTQAVGIIIICALVAGVVAAVGYATLRKRSIQPSTAKMFASPNNTPLDRFSHMPMAGGGDECDDFAMLSNAERFMRSQNARQENIMAAMTGKTAASSTPTQPKYVGSRGSHSQSRVRGSTHRSAPKSEFLSGGNYPTTISSSNPHSRASTAQTGRTAPRGPSGIFFNDIDEDDILAGNRLAADVRLTVPQDRVPVTRATMAASQQRANTNDLHFGGTLQVDYDLEMEPDWDDESVDVDRIGEGVDLNATVRGPGLSLSDLAETRRLEETRRMNARNPRQRMKPQTRPPPPPSQH